MLSHRVLITGGAGFLGAHLAERFGREHIPVRLFDLVARPPWSREPGIEYVRGDIRDPAAVAAVLEGVDSVVHAAFASPRQSPQLIQSVNVDGTRNLCAQALARDVRRFLLISSTIVQKPPRAHPFFPNAPLSRLDRYRAARAEAEVHVADYGRQGLPIAIVRPKTFLGPGRVSAFAILFEWIRLGRAVPILGAGRNRYQLLDIRDMAGGICMLEASRAGGVFHFGARQFLTIREDLQALLDHARTGSRLRSIPAGPARAMLRGMELAGAIPLSEWHTMSARNEDSVVDLSRAQRELGWQPERSNAQALVEAYEWYVASVRTNGRAPSTHPVPLLHRALKGLSQLLPR